MWIIVGLNALSLIGIYLSKNKKIKSNLKRNKIIGNQSNSEKDRSISSKPDSGKDKAISNKPDLGKDGTISNKSNLEEKKNINNKKGWFTWDNWTKIIFWIIVVYEFLRIICPNNSYNDSNNIILNLLIIFIFAGDVLYIENNNATEEQKKINNFFEILIVSVILSAFLIFIFVPGPLVEIKLSAAMELFKLTIGSVLLEFVIKHMFSNDTSTNKVTWKNSFVSVLTLIVLFVSYSSFSAIENSIGNKNDYDPSLQDFRKFVGRSNKSDLRKYNDIINKALKKQKSTSKHQCH